MNRDRALEILACISEVQTAFLEEDQPAVVFDKLLSRLLLLTESEYGFIGEIRESEEGEPFLKTHAITNIAWDEPTRKFYEENAPNGLEFTNLESLFGAVITTQEPVLANSPDTDPRACGRPEGHPPLRAFLGLPLFFGEEMIGMAGVANREGGYDQDLVDDLHSFITTCANIIRGHRNACERKAAEEALRESEMRFRRLVEADIIGVISADTRGLITEGNDAFLRLVGYERSDLPLRWDAMTPPEWRFADEKALRQIQEKGFAEPWEKEYIRKNGTRVPIILGVALLEGSKENVIGFVLDLSKQKQMEAEQQELRERLRQSQKMEAVGTVAAGIAHDFNNLLTALRGWVDLANVSTPADSDSKPALAEIEVAIGRGVDLTRTLLTFSRSASSEKKPIDLGQLLRDSARMLQAMVPASIELVVDARDGGSSWVEANATEMQQVIINLIVNARDAMSDGGKLLLRGERADDGKGPFRISVEDQGTGMDEETLKRLFDPFFTTKARGRGTGLGMSLVHGVVNDHGGTIEVHSERGVGTRIEIELPGCEAPTDVARDEPRPLRPGRGETVLIAEDDTQVRAVIGLTLTNSGYEPIEVADGSAALDAVRSAKHRIRLAILDVDMPKLDGLECLAQIRKYDDTVPVIIISGFHLPNISEWQDSNVLFVPKPLRVDELTRTVGEILERTAPQAH